MNTAFSVVNPSCNCGLVGNESISFAKSRGSNPPLHFLHQEGAHSVGSGGGAFVFLLWLVDADGVHPREKLHQTRLYRPSQ